MTAQSPAKRPTIKILLYTDDPYVLTDGQNFLGLGSMIERIEAHSPMFAALSVKWVSRSSDENSHADNTLDLVMAAELEQTGEPFDEIWFFGLHQANTEKFSLGTFRGGPNSELSAAEIAALDHWMRVRGGVGGGGVLMTGDHNNPAPPTWLKHSNGAGAKVGEGAKLLGLGRAIGRGVPRAGQLRKWDGPPSSCDGESVNTLASDGFQTDRVPQKLIYQLVNADGEPDPKGQPHPLFFYRSQSFIDVFPDHRHEGELTIPDLADTTVWPVGQSGQPKPCVIAYGTDKNSGRRIGLLTAYDGDRAGVGRIVADSSWHHYLNINLKGFPHPARPESDSDKLGQFYSNLAIWLAPIHKRRQMAQTMYWELADYTLLLEQQDDPIRIGEIAYSLLARSTSRCEIHELLRAFQLQQGSPRQSPDSRRAHLGSTEQASLGLVLDSFQKAMLRSEQGTLHIGSSELEHIVTVGLSKASVAAVSSGSSSRIHLTHRSNEGGEKSTMISKVENKEWTIEMKGDSEPGALPFVATLVFSLSAQDGVVTGKVWDGIGRQFLSSVKGTHQPLQGTDHWFLSLDFRWGNVTVELSGVTVETPQTVLFSGRYRASALSAVARNGGKPERRTTKGLAFDVEPEPPPGPGEGDTGSSTGQQT